MFRTRLYADPSGRFLHNEVLAACRQYPGRTAIVDTSLTPPRRISFAEYGEMVESLARGLISAGLAPGETIAIFLYNCWEFCAAYHAATLARAIPTPVNPSYREREVRYQLENSDAAFLITDGSLIAEMNLGGLPRLRRIFTTRTQAGDAVPFTDLLGPNTAALPSPEESPEQTIAALPYSSGTTGLPKGVMLSHYNLVVNIYQLIGPGAAHILPEEEVALCFLPLYHIYGLNVVLNPRLIAGHTMVLMPRFDSEAALRLIAEENVTYLPVVPPVLNIFCQAAEQGRFPRDHKVLWVKSGAAPLAPELPRRFTTLTGIPVAEGYGMTEASPVTHLGFEHGPLYRPESIGQPVALTDCLLIGENLEPVSQGELGELVMRGPQFMLGYWKSPQATDDVMRPVDGTSARADLARVGMADRWYWSGDVARVDEQGLYYIVDRRKEMIKYKGFPVAPAEVEAVLLEHPAVRDCGVIGRPDTEAGEIPCAFVVVRDGFPDSDKTARDICGFVAERLTGYKQPRQLRFVPAIPRNPSGKILRRELRKLLE